MSYKDHENDFGKDAWKDYTLEELGQWIALLTKRASHRSNPDKSKKDIVDAQNYLEMLNEAVKNASDEIRGRI